MAMLRDAITKLQSLHGKGDLRVENSQLEDVTRVLGAMKLENAEGRSQHSYLRIVDFLTPGLLVDEVVGLSIYACSPNPNSPL